MPQYFGCGFKGNAVFRSYRSGKRPAGGKGGNSFAYATFRSYFP
ncbi:hypothetical protein NXV73_00325 [Bacteroides salyersiae]|nr:hypothetical protein [Bacteroides salyersiae]